MAAHGGVLSERVVLCLSFRSVLHDPLTAFRADLGAFVHERFPATVVGVVEPRQNGRRELGVLTKEPRMVEELSVEHALRRYPERVGLLAALCRQCIHGDSHRDRHSVAFERPQHPLEVDPRFHLADRQIPKSVNQRVCNVVVAMVLFVVTDRRSPDGARVPVPIGVPRIAELLLLTQPCVHGAEKPRVCAEGERHALQGLRVPVRIDPGAHVPAARASRVGRRTRTQHGLGQTHCWSHLSGLRELFDEGHDIQGEIRVELAVQMRLDG